ncbi:MAG TPA: hypothetical protein VL400_15890 [Polyangiaceae bacterium]|jgi:hypothetical protein|nr:hypothetical protein [Polyangiaceae bacterium]
MSVSRAFAVGVLLVSGSGCASQAPDERGLDDDAEAKRVHAVIVVERVDGSDGSRGSVSAKFIRVSEPDLSLAERLVGSRPLLPEATECLAIPTLEQAEAEAQRRAILLPESAPLALRARGGPFFDSRGKPRELDVELLDVGDVHLSVRGADDASGTSADLALAPRAFPDVGDIASGIFYTSPDASQAFAAPGRYHVGGTGTDALEAFDLDVAAPSAPGGLRVAGTALDDDPAASTDAISVARGADVPIEWTTERTDGDIVYVDVRGDSTIRCAFPDTGSLVLPAELVQRLEEVAGPSGASTETASELTLTVHRYAERHATVSLPHASSADAGVADAIVRFDLARTQHLTVR